MKVVGYARTTWAEQVRGTFPSVEEQERALEAFAKKTGLVLEVVHSDTGLGPEQGTRAGLINILDSMEEEWQAVIVTSACRLLGARNVSFDPVAELTEHKKRVLLADARTAEALAKLMPRIAPKPAPKPAPPQSDDERRREIAERLLRGREAGAKAGKHQSGPAPFGYRRDYTRRGSEGVLLLPDPVEADIVRLIFREYLRLRSMKRLIKLLDEQGLRTRRGKRWSRAGVSWILKNDTYVGRVHFGDIKVKGRHEPLVSPIQFNKVQKLIRVNNKRGREREEEEAELVAVEASEEKAPRAPAKPAPSPGSSGRAKRREPAHAAS